MEQHAIRLRVAGRFTGAGVLSALALVLALAVPLAKGAAASGEATGRPGHQAQTLQEMFRNPPADSRILKIIHSWPDGEAEQDALIHSLAAKGFGGVVCNVSFAEYLASEAKWKAFARAVQAAKQAGFALWLYDEKGYPSGTAGGIVLREHLEWEARGLLVADAEGDAGTITVDVPPGKPFLMAAFPVQEGQIVLRGMTNLAAQVHEGRLSWSPPPGRWKMLAITESRLFEGTHASMSLSDHIPYLNLLQPEPTARFLAATHEAYAQHLGPDLGRWFVSTFTDEPSLMSLFLRQMPYRVLPWSPNLPVEFKKRRGYALEPQVPALVADAGPAGQRARYDYWQTVGELVAESYFGQIQAWCARHHLLSGGHLLMEEDLVNQVPLYGDFFGCLRRLNAPSIDCLTSIPGQVPCFIARLAGSAADLENRTVTMCETSDHSQRYRPAGDQRPVVHVTEEQIRGTCNRLFVGGISTITSYYSFAGLSDEQLRHLNEWVGRCCAALKGGHRVADIAVLYPIQSVWPRFNPAHRLASESPAAARIETLYREVSDGLFAAGRDFAYVDGRALAEAKVAGGALVHGKLRWRVVVLPGADTLPLAAWENLARFVRSGGVLISVGDLPANSEAEFPSSRVQALARDLFGPGEGGPRVSAKRHGGGAIFLPGSSAALLPTVISQLLAPDVEVAGTHSPIRPTHRRINGQEVYFLINDSAQPWSGRVGLSVDGPGEYGDPGTGQVTPLASGSDVPLSLPSYGAALFRFPKTRPPKLLGFGKNVLPQLATSDLPEASPKVACGEFVREQLTPEAAPRGEGRRAWQAVGRLMKSQVDTFLFVRFPYADGLDLRKAEWLVLDTWVPPAQRTPTQLLVVLRQKNGAEYLASTGRYLGAAGYEQTCLPLSRFQLAGWSNDPNGRFDPSSVTEIRVGWGGYFGSEGEKVEFTLCAPRSATTQ
jgi:hypothetical protein